MYVFSGVELPTQELFADEAPGFKLRSVILKPPTFKGKWLTFGYWVCAGAIDEAGKEKKCVVVECSET